MWNPFKKVTYQSKINGTITIGKQENQKALYAGGVTQSGGEIAPMWDNVIKKTYQNHNMKKAKKILILGVGGGSIINAIRHHDTTAHILGIEMDPVMIQIAREQFGIQENKKQNIIIADAIEWLYNQAKKNLYDLIVVDLYIGPLNPLKSRTKKFLEQLKLLLHPKGILLYNAHYQKKNISEYEKFRKHTDALYTDAKEVFSYPLNRVLLLRK